MAQSEVDAYDRRARQLISKVRGDLRQFGLLPFAGSECLSVVSVVVGAPLTGSWWGHPAGQLIYRVGNGLEDDDDVLFVKLWRGRVTLVHRRLWPALVRVGTARSGWQTDTLGADPRRLLSLIDRDGSVRSDRIPTDFAPGARGFRPALRELERRLLVVTRSVHTPSGAHALVGESWSAWSTRVGAPRFSGSVASAEGALEVAASRLGLGTHAVSPLPWTRATQRGSEGSHGSREPGV
jgi:hypothetical protein